MFDYKSFTWTPHPLDDEDRIFSLSVAQEEFRPLGYILETVIELESDEPDSYVAGKLQPEAATIYYIPETPGEIDFNWLKAAGPIDPQELIDWSRIALQEYVAYIDGFAVDGVPDDFPARLLISIEENQLCERFRMKKEEIVRIVNEQGVAPFLSVDEIVVNQPKGLFQVCCNCVLDNYTDEYDFGVYRHDGEIYYAAPQFKMPEW